MPALGDIFRAAGKEYRQAFGDRMLPSHERAMLDIERCRSPDLGGHLYRCDSCGATELACHSCRNRHCPTCQAGRADRWYEKSRELLLPCDYYLFTFTLPEELRPLARSHQRVVYDILIRAAAQSLLKLAADTKYVGGRLAILAVLHTWSRALIFHPHIHILVTAGGLAPDRSTWIKPANPRFLVPGYALQIIFRAKVRDALEEVGLKNYVPQQVWRTDWCVHGKHVGNGSKTLLYLARYVFRVAISNDRIESFDGNRVTFRWKDSKSGCTRRANLEVNEFIRRFLQHILPSGFVKVRYYGLWAPSCRSLLDTAKRILVNHLAGSTQNRESTTGDTINEPRTTKHRLCAVCGVGQMVKFAEIPKGRAPPW